MNRCARISLGVMGTLLVGGCRTATQVTEVPRVDLAIEGGNRGYLVGAPPAPAGQRTTREMVETTIEIPSFYTPKRSSVPVSLEGVAVPQAPVEVAAGSSAPAADEPSTTYVVQKGESLWSIAKKPEIYGKASKWRRIFDANRDLLKTPDRVKAGMTLKIPRGHEGGPSGASSSDEGTLFKK